MKTIKDLTLSAIIASVSVLVLAKCDISHASQPHEVKYLNKNMSPIAEEAAFMSGVRGEKVYKCQTVEFKIGKSGTSGSLRNVKKPKADADIDQAIEELKEQKDAN